MPATKEALRESCCAASSVLPFSSSFTPVLLSSSSSFSFFIFLGMTQPQQNYDFPESLYP